MNLVDNLFAEHVIRNGKTQQALERVRGLVSEVYDYNYQTTQELYGEANDVDGLGWTGEDTTPPLAQVNPRRASRPYTPVDTPWTEDGFSGLDPPLG